jgi:hypothetical protein
MAEARPEQDMGERIHAGRSKAANARVATTSGATAVKACGRVGIAGTAIRACDGALAS